MHVPRWFHLYTDTGSFAVCNRIGSELWVRDASEVGLENLERLVQSVILGEKGGQQ